MIPLKREVASTVAVGLMLLGVIQVAAGRSQNAESDLAVSEPLPEFWIESDEWNLEVSYVITPDEMQAYRQLETVGQREAYIDQFWERRDPSPGTAVNEYRNEYESRVRYANDNLVDPQSFAGYGFQTARGRIYILFGPPEEIERNPDGPEANEVWHYSELDGPNSDFVAYFSQSPVISCSGAYPFRILSPDPDGTFQGVSAEDDTAAVAEAVSVRTYSGGFVSILIPMDFTSTVGVRWEVRASAGRVVDAGQMGFATEDEIRESGETRGLAEHLVVPPFDVRGEACTKVLPPGSYELSTAVGFLGGRVHRETVVFSVE